jgi:hypothetical protein
MKEDLFTTNFDPVLVEDGVYQGTMHGYEVKFKNRNGQICTFNAVKRTLEQKSVKIVVNNINANIYLVQ